MNLKTAAALAALLLAAPAVASDQARQQVRDPATHTDGSATQQRDRTRDQTQARLRDGSHAASQERTRAMKGAGQGAGAGGSGNAYRGGK
jgi:hypothetical protein